MKFDFTGLLKNEMKPALGVTESARLPLRRREPMRLWAVSCRRFAW